MFYSQSPTPVSYTHLVGLELEQWKDRLSIVQADQSDKESFARFVQIVKSKAESINCIVCNAGMTIRKPNMGITDEQWEQVMQVAVNSHFFLIRDCYEMIEPDSRIIFIGSMMEMCIRDRSCMLLVHFTSSFKGKSGIFLA